MMIARKSDATGESMLNGMPTWIKAIAVVGFPAVVALVLILWMLKGDATAHAQHQQLLQATTEQTKINATLLNEAHEERRQYWEQANRQDHSQLMLLRQICIHTSKTDQERNACVVQ